MSKEPRPLPKPGDPQYRDPTKPHPSSPPPPRKRLANTIEEAIEIEIYFEDKRIGTAYVGDGKLKIHVTDNNLILDLIESRVIWQRVR